MDSYRRTISAAVATALASFALYPIFSGPAWFWAGVGAAITVALAGTLTRLRRLPVTVCVAGGIVGLLLYLNVVFAHSQSLLLVIPTSSSLAHLWHLAGQGFSESSRYAPPVPELAGMVLLATGGIGLAALLVDLISVRLGSAALAGLPLLLLLTEPFTLSVKRGWLGTTAVFCLATAGYLTMLSSEGRERIREWEQPRSGQRSDVLGGKAPDTRALAAAGRRVGVASAIVALCVPLFVPGLHFTRLFGSGSPGIGGAGGSGSGTVGVPSPLTQIQSDLTERSAKPVLTYTSTAAAPGYLQLYVLGTLTADDGWQLTQPGPLVSAAALPAAPGLTDTAAASIVSTDITTAKNLGQDTLSALPAPYPAVSARASGSSVQGSSGTLMLFDTGASLAGLSYTVTSEDVEPSGQALAAAPRPPADMKPYLSVPPSYDALRQLAQSIVTGATTPYAQAVDLQNYFSGTGSNFSYTTAATTITNETGLANFLYTTQAGYCQQFSFAMAVLARLLGIPSRVVYGFTQGTHVAGGEWQVTTHDAHAWPELYFQGFGWLRFEPTPGESVGGLGTATAPAYAQQKSGSSGSSSAGSAPSTSASTGAGAKNSRSALDKNKIPDLGGDNGNVGVRRAAGGPSPWALAGLSLLGLLMLVVIVPACARSVIRRRRWRAGARAGDAGLAHAAWLELRDDLSDYGAGYSPSETPRALAARVTAQARLGTEQARPGTADAVTTAGLATLVHTDGPGDAADLVGTADLAYSADLDAGAALRRVTMAAERARYSARPASGAGLRQDSATVRRALAASTSRRARWQARVFPSSVVAPVVIALSQATDAFGRLNLSRVQPWGRRRPSGKLSRRRD